MSITKNIQMSEFNRTDYNILLPQTRLDFELGNEYIWEKILFETHNEYDESSQNNIFIFPAGSPPNEVTFIYGDTYSVNDDGVHITINHPNEITLKRSSPASILDAMKGKWWQEKKSGYSNKVAYYLPATATITRGEGVGFTVTYSSNVPIIFRQNFHNVTTRTDAGFVNSPSSNAYPPVVGDGYTYRPLGQLGAQAFLYATGTYIGTGDFGQNNKNTLTFPFVPRLIMISDGYLQLERPGMIYYGQPADYASVSSEATYVNAKLNDTTFSWYSDNATAQSNSLNKKYYYTAFG